MHVTWMMLQQTDVESLITSVCPIQLVETLEHVEENTLKKRMSFAPALMIAKKDCCAITPYLPLMVYATNPTQQQQLINSAPTQMLQFFMVAIQPISNHANVLTRILTYVFLLYVLVAFTMLIGITLSVEEDTIATAMLSLALKTTAKAKHVIITKQ